MVCYYSYFQFPYMYLHYVLLIHICLFFITHKYPEFYSFPPFFTIQPILETREKQLSLWRDLILKYHTKHRIPVLIVHDCPLWTNQDIDRSLTREDIAKVMDDFVSSGFGEWEDASLKTRCRILWRHPKQLASDIYEWAQANGLINGICTLYELHSGEDINGEPFEGADEELLRRAVNILEEQGKATLFKGETSSEDGIKFFP